MKPPVLDATAHLFGALRDSQDVAVKDRLEFRSQQLYSTLFPRQRAYLADEHPWKVLLCPRRSGKTVVIVVEHLLGLATRPYYRGAYITVTRTQAKKNIWELLQQYSSDYHLELEFHHNELYVRSPMGGILYLGGGLTESDMMRYRGLQLDKATIDETASFDPDRLKSFLEDVLEPTLLDRFGTLTLAGTPGAVCAGAFYDVSGDGIDAETGPAFIVREYEAGKHVTSRPYRERNSPKWNGVEFLYSFHGWSMAENDAMPHIWEEAVRRHKLRGGDDQDPTWQREALGRWVSDISAFVYRYQQLKNAWTPLRTERSPFGLPEGHEWNFIAGVDLGYDDAFAIEVGAWSPTFGKFFHCHEFVEPNLTISEMADAIKAVEAQFPQGFDVIVGDTQGLGKAIFEEMRRKFSISIVPAQKSNKRDYIEFVNSELLAGRCLVMAGSVLEQQLKTVQWADPRTKKVVHPKMDDDACDAWLYLMRYALHHFAIPLVSNIQKGTPEWWREKEREAEERAEREERLRRTSSVGELLFASLDRRYDHPGLKLGRFAVRGIA